MLTADEVAEFHENGYLLGHGVLDDATVDALRADLERIVADTSTDGPQPLMKSNLGDAGSPIWQILDIWLASDAFRELLSHPTIVEEVAQLSGAQELKVWHDQVQYKPSGQGGVNMWHQDSPVWKPLTPKDAQLTAWVALDDADAENGCMSMVRGSHRWGDHLDYLQSLESFDALPSELDGHRVTAELRPVKAGHVHYHHPLTWHGSAANRTGRPRRAIAVHYMTERTRYMDNPPPDAQIFVLLLGITAAPGEPIASPYFVTVYDHGEVHPVAPSVETRTVFDIR